MEWIEREIYAKQESTRQVFVDEEFLKNLDIVYREKAVDAFRMKVEQFGKFDHAEQLLLLNIDKWFKQKELSNSESIKKKSFHEEAINIANEKRQLEIEMEKLKIEKDAYKARADASDARELARVNEEREKLKKKEEEIKKKLKEEKKERERKENEKFERNQRENLSRIHGEYF